MLREVEIKRVLLLFTLNYFLVKVLPSDLEKVIFCMLLLLYVLKLEVVKHEYEEIGEIINNSKV